MMVLLAGILQLDSPAMNNIDPNLERALQVGIQKDLPKKFDKIGKLVTSHMRQMLRGYVTRPTKLEKDIQYKVLKDGVLIYTESPISKFLNDGTEPHIIRPKNGKALAFRAGGNAVTKKGDPIKFGQKIVVQEVHHPGFEARPFFNKTVFLTRKKVQEILMGDLKS